MGPIFIEKVVEKRNLLKKEICESREQCMGPTDRQISVKIFVGKRGSGSRAQCRGPIDITVSHVKCGS